MIGTDPAAKCAAKRAQLDVDADDATGNYNGFWAERDYVAGSLGDVSKVHASVFVVHNVNDLNVKPDNFSVWRKALADRNVPRKIRAGQYQHVDPRPGAGRRFTRFRYGT